MATQAIRRDFESPPPAPVERHEEPPVERVEPPDQHWRFSPDQVLRMVETGILDEGERVELVRGELLQMAPQGPEHGALKDALAARLIEAYRGREVNILNQRPIRVGPEGLPEPDLAVLRGSFREYLHKHPEGTDALLVVEVAMTSRGRDQRKAADYARGGVPVYWLLDIAGRTLDVHTDPDRERGRYRLIASLNENDSVALPDLGLEWKVATLLP